MAQVSKCDKLTEHDRLRLVGRIGEGISWDNLQIEFGIAQSSLRAWAERNGHGRSPTASKRKMVEDLLAKSESSQSAESAESALQSAPRAVSTGNDEVDAAAHEDVRDMRLGLQAARLALQVSELGLKAMRDSGDLEPRNAKLWSECVAINVTTIRKIRGLDDTTATANITIANPRSFD
jgi:hypothetical protein